MAANPILADVSDKFGARMTVGFYDSKWTWGAAGLGVTNDRILDSFDTRSSPRRGSARRSANRAETKAAWSNSMTRSARIAIAAALLLGGTSLATAKIRGAVGVHGIHHRLKGDQTSRRKDRPSAIPQDPGINETTSRPTAADPYYRLSDSYYGYSDPYRGLYDFYAVPPYSPGYTYGHVRPGGWQ
jgi:hypothetical protein